jgi:hypothetical protein
MLICKHMRLRDRVETYYYLMSQHLLNKNLENYVADHYNNEIICFNDIKKRMINLWMQMRDNNGQ